MAGSASCVSRRLGLRHRVASIPRGRFLFVWHSRTQLHLTFNVHFGIAIINKDFKLRLYSE